ncbi:hypothetical protein ACFL1I_05795 [Candidatus Omnitrophota bacterium]
MNIINRIFCVLIPIFLSAISTSFAQKVATTVEGRQAILYKNGTWEYINDKALREEIYRVNKQLKDALYRYYLDRTPYLVSKFGLHADWDTPYDAKYKGMIVDFHDAKKHWIRQEDFQNELVRMFGKEVGLMLDWVLENFVLWEKYCRYDGR